MYLDDRDNLLWVRKYERVRFGALENVTAHWRGYPGGGTRHRSSPTPNASGAASSKL